ncbi:fibrinogen C domain-containing protein 1-like [Anastrepha ludens]|uniref:fibrinogen C domain-containing protein 1-like n=1 Tax=Anastrepha ludens TaxID=28586 RepID=UPI0023B074F7|nr:fibrinogen C domain-containing protein 1-like [Anastrepha ludens]
MYLGKLTVLQFILVFAAKLCLSENNELDDICVPECDVSIDVIKHFADKLGSVEQLVKGIFAGNESLQAKTSLKTYERLPTNCMEAAVDTFKSGIYEIQFERFSETPFSVWCDEETDFGGWIVIQRRVNSDESFYRTWLTYQKGFGNLSANYWIGLEKLHALTSSCEQELYIKMETFDDKNYYAKYDAFVVGSENEGYVLRKVGKFSGNSGDYLQYHEGSKFSTYDRDNDESDENCAIVFAGGWWYHKCYWTNLNGDYAEKFTAKGVTWNGIEERKSLKFVQMMIRPTEKCMLRLSMKNSFVQRKK